MKEKGCYIVVRRMENGEPDPDDRPGHCHPLTPEGLYGAQLEETSLMRTGKVYDVYTARTISASIPGDPEFKIIQRAPSRKTSVNDAAERRFDSLESVTGYLKNLRVRTTIEAAELNRIIDFLRDLHGPGHLKRHHRRFLSLKQFTEYLEALDWERVDSEKVPGPIREELPRQDFIFYMRGEFILWLPDSEWNNKQELLIAAVVRLAKMEGRYAVDVLRDAYGDEFSIRQTAILKLQMLMSEISIESHQITWIAGLEYALYDLALAGGGEFGNSYKLSPETASRLLEYSAICNGWIVWDKGPTLLRMSDWNKLSMEREEMAKS